jgi:two-component system, chemotaxis family, sensor kinase CheA
MGTTSTGAGAGGAGPVDLSQFFRVFFEEAAEHLATMETLLVSIAPEAPSAEDIGAIFRAAHSIKGGAGTFGFTDMAAVTHEAETLLDKVRTGTLPLTAAMVDVLLEARDVVQAQLGRHRGDPGAESPDPAPTCARIRAFLDGGAAAAAPATPARAETTRWEARILRNAAGELPHAIDALVTELARHGNVARRDDGPGRACVLEFDAPGAIEDVRELFAFTVAPEQLELRPAKTPVPDAAAAAPAAPAAETSYGFFDDAPGAPHDEHAAPADDGFGFFDGAPGAPHAAPAPAAAADAPKPYGRRSTDDPGVAAGRAGRREGDKVVATMQGEAGSIRVGVEKVDQLVNQVGELVITNAMLAQACAQLDPIDHQRLFNGLAALERSTRDLQESVMSIRMLPMAFVFNRFPRMVRDLAGKLGKQVELVTVGEGTELDKGLIERVADPLNHLVRNSIDHGIEMPDERVAAGKPAKGTITLRAAHQGGSIIVEVADDGKGLDRDRILAKARERGMAAPDSLTDAEVWQLIFEAGFSTAEIVTDVSGRGVGMDVVKRNIGELGGTVEIASVAGHGTRMTIRLPLTLAIMDGMSVGVGGETYILPLAAVVESLQPGAADLRTVAGHGRVVEVRAEYLPVVAMRDVHGLPPRTDGAADILVVVESEGAKTALLVDELLGQQQIVVKNLERNYRRVHGVSGATILGDGSVALILDVPALVRRARH